MGDSNFGDSSYGRSGVGGPEIGEPPATPGPRHTVSSLSDAKSPADLELERLAEGLEVMEIAGTIKWFDASKGFGFIIPDNPGLGDVLLHVTCLRAGGFQTAYEGARLHAQVLRRPKGLQAFRIISMDESTAIHPSQLPHRTHVVVQPESDWERALVKWFNRVRGFGFLTRGEGTPDVFVHMETLRRYGFTELRPGQIVQVRWGMGYKGCMAAELRPDGAAAGYPASH
jgi:CspA family cold shock protein